MEQNIVTLASDIGMPNQQVHNLVIDKYQRLWLAGPSGLCCYNGNSIRVYDTRDGLKCSGLRTVTIQNDDLLWIGTDQGIELMTLDGSFIELQLQFKWIFGIAECFLLESNFLWVGTSNGLLKLERRDNELHLIESLDIGLVSQLTHGEDCILAVVVNKGLIAYSDKKATLFCDTLPASAFANCVARTIDHQYLIGTSEGLYVANAQGEITGQYKPTTFSKKVTSIMLWKDQWIIAFSDQLKVLSQHSFNLTELETIPIRGSINNLDIDTLGNIWVATNNAGLKKVSIFRNVIQRIDVGRQEAVFSTRFYPEQQSFHIGGEGFFSILQFSDKGHLPKLTDFYKLDTIVWDTIIDPMDATVIWMATQDGVYVKKGESAVNRDGDISVQIGAPTRVLLHRDEIIYVGTIGGLYTIHDGKVDEVKKADGRSFGYVYSLSLSPEHKIWVATLGEGLWIENEKGFENFVDDHLTETGNTYSVQFNSLGEAIVLQQENIILIDKDFRSTVVAQEYPMSGWSCTWIDEGMIAVGTDSGLNIVDVRKKEVKKKLNLYLERSDWQATSSRSLIHLEDSRLYYGQISGLYHINIREIEQLETVPEVLLDYVSWKNTQAVELSNGYRVVRGKWTLDIGVYCTWYLDERQVEFRFKLAGFDENWSPLSKLTMVSYNSLPIGKYELFVQVYSPFTGFVEETSLFKIYVVQSARSVLRSIAGYLGSFFTLKETRIIKNKLLLQHNELIQQEREARKRLEEEFEKYKRELENLVQQRTKELKKQKERAESLDKQKSMFLASMSHEIRTPLSGISGLAELMKDTDLQPIQREFLKKIETSSNHLLEIINNILDISKIEAGQMELENKPFSIFQLMKEVVDFAHIKNQHQELDIILDEDINTDYLIKGDAVRMKQVLLNLVSNAIKFTEKGHVVLRIKQLETDSGGVTLKFAVDDTGIGIEKADLAMLFRDFKQVGAGGDKAYGGTGLGLSISYNFIEKMGGTLRVDSTIDKGSSFSFTLKFEGTKELDSHSFASEMSKANLEKSILLVNCTDLDIKLLSRDLKRIGCIDVEATATLEAAKTQLKKKTIDLGILNLTQYNSNLWDDFSEVRNASSSKDTHWIAIATSKHPDLSEKSFEHGIEQIILKPFTKSDLQRAIHTTFNKALPKKEIDLQEIRPSEKQFKDNKEKYILVAEDDAINQLVIKQVLEREGYSVIVSSNGAECVLLFESSPKVDLILMDLQMPKLNGLEATKIIRARDAGRQVPIIAFTADVTREMNDKIIAFGLNGAISKPIDFKQLHKVLNKWLH